MAKLSLTAGLEKDRAKEVLASFKGATTFRKQLVKVLEKKIDAERKITSGKSFLDKPNWELQVASSLAYERSIRELIDLLSEEK